MVPDSPGRGDGTPLGGARPPRRRGRGSQRKRPRDGPPCGGHASPDGKGWGGELSREGAPQRPRPTCRAKPPRSGRPARLTGRPPGTADGSAALPRPSSRRLGRAARPTHSWSSTARRAEGQQQRQMESPGRPPNVPATPVACRRPKHTRHPSTWKPVDRALATCKARKESHQRPPVVLPNPRQRRATRAPHTQGAAGPRGWGVAHRRERYPCRHPLRRWSPPSPTPHPAARRRLAHAAATENWWRLPQPRPIRLTS